MSLFKQNPRRIKEIFIVSTFFFYLNCVHKTNLLSSRLFVMVNTKIVLLLVLLLFNIKLINTTGLYNENVQVSHLFDQLLIRFLFLILMFTEKVYWKGTKNRIPPMIHHRHVTTSNWRHQSMHIILCISLIILISYDEIHRFGWRITKIIYYQKKKKPSLSTIEQFF